MKLSIPSLSSLACVVALAPLAPMRPFSPAALSGEGEGRTAVAAAARIDEGVAAAEAGDLMAAIDAFAAAREIASELGAAGESAWSCASFDEARALHDRAAGRSLPALPPDQEAVPAPLLADARARLSASRGDLEAARARLLELLERNPDDAGAKAGLARVARLLREVLARDAAWRALRPRQADSLDAGAEAAPGPLRSGTASTRGSAGAPGKRTGASEPASGAATPGGDAPQSATGIDDEPLTFEEVRTLRERLTKTREEGRNADERRAAAAVRAAGRRL